MEDNPHLHKTRRGDDSSYLIPFKELVLTISPPNRVKRFCVGTKQGLNVPTAGLSYLSPPLTETDGQGRRDAAGYSNTYCAKNDKDISVGLLMIAPVKGRAAEEGKRKKQVRLTWSKCADVASQSSEELKIVCPTSAGEDLDDVAAVLLLRAGEVPGKRRDIGEVRGDITGEALATCDTLVEEVVRLHLRVLDAKHERGDLASLSSPRSC
uniref:OSJNBa0073E02.2 protein n=1 Tax=Oryza sativa subsp. japonica TaxID=39947 RepID=Q7XRR7_ORYSJ|nr:OSJNBb0072M01.17 [Oryza sativa Japonica Group]CAE05442.1 OSJNBa0073E02.2 [Oryza sativa Japonica Group]